MLRNSLKCLFGGSKFTKPPVKVAVTGTSGRIGYSMLFRIADGNMLGPD